MRTFFRFPQNWGLGGLLLLLLLPNAVQARGHQQATTLTPKGQAQAFALSYALRDANAQALRFTQAVKTLKDVDDDQTAGAEVAHLAEQAARLRKTEAECYAQAARLLSSMGAAPDLRAWAGQAASGFRAPLILEDDAKQLAKAEPATATVLAELKELRAVKETADAHQSALTTELKLSGDKDALWAADMGSLAADLDLSARGETQTAISVLSVRRLLQAAPSGTPFDVLESLALLAPRGGNLQFLATVSTVKVPPQEREQALKTFLRAFDARKLAEALDKER